VVHTGEESRVGVVKGACGTDKRREYLGWKPSRKSPFVERDIYGRIVLKSGMNKNNFLSVSNARTLKVRTD
jgi:hypothetical protein